MPTEAQKLEQLVQVIAPQGKLLRTWELKGGISATMTALEIERPDRQASRMIVRWPGAATLEQRPHAASDEFKLLQLMKSLGLATPTPYYLDQTGRIFPTPYLVIEYIEGQPEFAPAQLGDFTLQLATHLAKVHRLDSARLDLSFLPRSTAGAQLATGATALDQAQIREVLEPAWPLQQRNSPALLHGDFWPGNILWRDGTLVAVIDWEDAAIGDPLTDLAISRIDLRWIYGTDAMHSFTRHYQSLMPIDYSALPYWDLYAALRLARLAGTDLAGFAAFFRPFGRPDITEHTIREHYQQFVAQARHKIERSSA